MKLTDLHVKQKGVINKIGDLVELNQRLLDLGISSGETIEIIRKAPFGNPIELRVNNEYFVLRAEDAQKIEVEDL